MGRRTLKYRQTSVKNISKLTPYAENRLNQSVDVYVFLLIPISTVGGLARTIPGVKKPKLNKYIEKEEKG